MAAAPGRLKLPVSYAPPRAARFAPGLPGPAQFNCSISVRQGLLNRTRFSKAPNLAERFEGRNDTSLCPLSS
jgi:hypothetical protein